MFFFRNEPDSESSDSEFSDSYDIRLDGEFNELIKGIKKRKMNEDPSTNSAKMPRVELIVSDQPTRTRMTDLLKESDVKNHLSGNGEMDSNQSNIMVNSKDRIEHLHSLVMKEMFSVVNGEQETSNDVAAKIKSIKNESMKDQQYENVASVKPTSNINGYDHEKSQDLSHSGSKLITPNVSKRLVFSEGSDSPVIGSESVIVKEEPSNSNQSFVISSDNEIQQVKQLSAENGIVIGASVGDLIQHRSTNVVDLTSEKKHVKSSAFVVSSNTADKSSVNEEPSKIISPLENEVTPKTVVTNADKNIQRSKRRRLTYSSEDQIIDSLPLNNNISAEAHVDRPLPCNIEDSVVDFTSTDENPNNSRASMMPSFICFDGEEEDPLNYT